MHKFEKANFNIDHYDETENYGKFVIEPLERGFGITLGNALRRVLLSSLPGSAVYAIKVQGAIHEFSAIDGVVEDVTAMILNIKKLLHCDNTVSDNSVGLCVTKSIITPNFLPSLAILSNILYPSISLSISF